MHPWKIASARAWEKGLCKWEWVQDHEERSVWIEGPKSNDKYNYRRHTTLRKARRGFKRKRKKFIGTFSTPGVPGRDWKDHLSRSLGKSQLPQPPSLDIEL